MHTAEEVAQGASLEFSLVRGGPFYRLGQALRLIRGDAIDVLRLSLASIAISWVPLVFLTAAQVIVTWQWPRLLADIAVEVRCLFVIPLLFVTDMILHVMSRRSLDRFHAARLAGPDADKVPELVTEIHRFRDALLPELAIAGLSFAAGITLLVGTGGTGLATVSADGLPASVGRIWYGLVSYPLFLFLNLRALWRWVLWCSLLWRLSRLRLQPEPTHPDRAGGFSFLADVSVAFAPFFTGLQAVAAASWGTLMLTQGVDAKSFLPNGGILLGVALAVTLSPLALFIPHLQRARVNGRRQYELLAIEYGRTFGRRWLGPRDAEALVGTTDITPMKNLAEVYEGIIKLSIIPFKRQTIIAIAVATLAPVGILMLTEIPLKDAVIGLARLLVGAPIG